MPCDRFGKALRTLPEKAAVCKHPAYCGPIRKKSSQWIKSKTGPIKPKFNGGKHLVTKFPIFWSNFPSLVEYVHCAGKKKEEKLGHLVFSCSTKKAVGEIKGDRKLALE